MQSASFCLYYITIYTLSYYTIFFSHYLIHGSFFLKKNIKHKMCVLIFSTTTFVRNVFHSKNINVHTLGLHVQYPLFSSDSNQTWIFPTDFRIILKYQKSGKSVQWEPSCSTRTDGRTWRFSNFANAPENERLYVALNPQMPLTSL